MAGPALFLLVAQVGAGLPRQIGPDSGSPTTFHISLESTRSAGQHGVQLDDLLSAREVLEPTLAPDGRSTAFLVRQAFRDCNCYRTAIYLTANKRGRIPRAILEDRSITRLRWAPDGQALTYLSNKSGSKQLWRISTISGVSELMFTHQPGDLQHYQEAALHPRNSLQVGVEEYEWAPDGSWIAFVSKPGTDPSRDIAASNNGVIYDDERMNFQDIQSGRWTSEPAELWVYNVQTRIQNRIWTAPTRATTSRARGIQGLAWSPNSRSIAFSYVARIGKSSGLPDYDIGVVLITQSKFETVAPSDSTNELEPCWLVGSATRLAFVSVYDILRNSSGSLTRLGIANLATREVKYLAHGRMGPSVDHIMWSAGDRSIVFQTSSPAGTYRGRSGLYRIDLNTEIVRRVTPNDDHIGECSQPVRRKVACVRQNLRLPPEPALVDLRTGSLYSVSVVNAQLGEDILNPVREVRWTNRYGDAANGYLVQPRRRAPSQRLPLIVVMYGFEGRFITAAEWITSFPVQVLATDGVAILLWNYPRWDGWQQGKSAGLKEVVESPLAALTSGVRLLVEQGLIDSTRVGLMGWSYGGFLANVAAAQTNAFRVASIGNDGDLNPGVYWLKGWRAYRVAMNGIFGGPPYGETLANWMTYAPAFNADRVRMPILMEASAEEALISLEMFSAFREHGVPVEFVIYPDEGHVVTSPAHRYASMDRNRDWFTFWLLDRIDPDPSKRDRYDRWRAMRSKVDLLSGGAERARAIH